MSEVAIPASLVPSDPDALPTFDSSSFDEHVEVWRTVDESMQNHLWMLAAIAASLVKRYGEDSAGRFASEIGRSTRTVRRFAHTYHEWEKRSALTVLSFQHHTIAARDPEPEEVIAMAHDNEWSTRELEVAVKERRSKTKGAKKYQDEEEETDVEENKEAMVLCPCCEGHSFVTKTYAKSIAKAIPRRANR